MAQVFSVSEINRYIKGRFDSDPLLGNVCVRGELSNYKIYPSGHHYFTLKDKDGALRCVMFKNNALRLRFRPENGMQVVCAGSISVYPRDGAYQLYAAALMPDGIGDLQQAFEQTKRHLFEEGLFDDAHKRPLPDYPKKIAVVTSGAGAAVRDVIRILRRRWPLSAVLVVPVRVQGSGAAEEIAAAIDLVNRLSAADLIITGRGGGSLEDLWAFNEEIVARAVYRSAIPVISAVGHEPDVVISDFVADRRASTPSNAAEIAVPDRMEIRESLNVLQNRIQRAITHRLQSDRQSLDSLVNRRALQDPSSFIQTRRQYLDTLMLRAGSAMERRIGEEKNRFGRACAALDALSPLKVLDRGYAILLSEGHATLGHADKVCSGERILVRTAVRELRCLVEENRALSSFSMTEELNNAENQSENL